MITFKHSGDFEKTEKFLKKASRKEYASRLDFYGKKGVQALKAATPVDSGETAASWGYKIVNTSNRLSIIWTNSNTTENGVPIAILIQYGHGTRNGVYVQGRDFINPAIQPIFDEISDMIRKEVSS